ncbi:MAG: hypothetical protein J6S53_01245 [Lentisphaeria bacterium]|nr:hypothetical protein [Lentisphaeria bacterium]
MKKTNSIKSIFLIFIVTVFLPAHSFADAFIGYLYPSGGQQGETIDIIVGGMQLWGTHTALITGEGCTVEKISSIPGFNHPYYVQRKYIIEAMKARKEGKLLPEKPEETPDWRPHKYYDRIGELTETEFNIAIAEFYAVRNSLQASPAISQKMLVTLKIDKNAKPGRREFRLATKGSGVSNPIPFYVGSYPEVNEGVAEIPPEKPEIKSFTIPATLNGQIMPGGEVDKFLFQAKKGEKITFKVRAREFAPFLGDGVPGHFQAIAEIFDSKGKSLTFADDFHGNIDPVLTFTVPADGQYAFTVRDSIYRGRADFVYRVEAFYGDTPTIPRLPFPALPENVKLFSKEAADKEEILKENVRICGTLDREKAIHTFRFKGEKGKTKVLEVLARRYGSPLDAVLILTDEKGNILHKNDDPKYPRIGIVHHQADPYILFTPEKDGIYTVKLFAADGHGGREYFYALRIDEKRPDFRVVLAPSAPNIAWSGSRPFLFHVFPVEGFKEDIVLSIKGTDKIFFDGTNIIPAGAEKVNISLACNWYRNNFPISFKIIARSGKITKEVIPADEAMQAFAYTHFIPAENFAVAKSWKYSGEGRFFWRGKLLSPGKNVPVYPPVTKKNKEKVTAKAIKKNSGKKGNRRSAVKRPPRPVKVPVKWVPPVYEKVDKVILKAGSSAELTLYAILSPHDMSYSVTMENPPKGVSIVKQEVIYTDKNYSSELLKITLKADKNAAKGVYNYLFKVKMMFDASPDKNGDIVRKETLVPLPVLRMEVK